MDAKKPQIAEQTAANYVYVYQRFIKPEIGEQSITAIGQRSIRAIQVSGVEFPILVKRIIKGVFEQAENWTHRPADHYADCIVIRSSRNEKRRDYVARGDIPSSKLVASFIITAYGTLQQNPLDDPAVTVWNPESATHKRSARRMSFAPGLGLTQPDDTCFRNGVPFETIYPDYQKPEEIKDDANRHATRLAFARPCGTRQIPDEAEAGRARRARCGRRRDSEGRSGTCAQGHVRHRRRSGPRAPTSSQNQSLPASNRRIRQSNHRFASTV